MTRGASGCVSLNTQPNPIRKATHPASTPKFVKVINRHSPYFVLYINFYKKSSTKKAILYGFFSAFACFLIRNRVGTTVYELNRNTRRLVVGIGRGELSGRCWLRIRIAWGELNSWTGGLVVSIGRSELSGCLWLVIGARRSELGSSRRHTVRTRLCSGAIVYFA